MLLLLQMCLVLVTATFPTSAAKIHHTYYYPADPFLSAHSDAVLYQDTQNSKEESTTLGPGNSAEIGATQQQNSNEIIGTQQGNSGEVGVTTFNPFNSGEVTSLPAVIKNPSDTNGQKTVEPGIDNNQATGSTSEQVKNTENVKTQDQSDQTENSVGVGTAAGTQPFFPQATGVKSQNESGSTTAQTENGGNVGAAISSQATGVKSQDETGSTSDQTENNAIVNTAAGTQPFFPQATGTKLQAESDSTTQEAVSDVNADAPGKPLDPNDLANAIQVAGVEPILLLEPNQEAASEGNSNTGELGNIPGIEPLISNSENSVPNTLRDTLAQVGVTETIDDPLLNEAKKNFLSIWNLEAHRLNAPYLEVTDVWPEIGMVYMPTINKMSSKIQNSKSVKEAAERLKSIWEELQPTTNETPAFGFLSDFINFFDFGRSGGIPLDDDLSSELFRRKKPEAVAASHSPIRKPEAVQRPVYPTHPASQRPAIRQAIKYDSLESHEFY